MFERIAIFGCKKTTQFLLENLQLPVSISLVVTIDPQAGAKHQVADYTDLRPVAEKLEIELYQAQQYSLKSEADQQFIKQQHIDVAFVMGWQRLIPASILHSLRIGAFGMHGSADNLPRGRGRSPMNWSIIEGRKSFYTNLFRYDPGVDSGDVLDTYKFQIGGQDTAETLHFKNTLAMKYLIEKNIDRLLRNDFALHRQHNIAPTYYLKRSPDDSLIDWRMNVQAIDRFIRAVTKPFNGAFSFIDQEKVSIFTAQVFDLTDFGFTHETAGTVVAVFANGKFLVSCFGGLLLVHDYEAGFIPEKGMRFQNNGQAAKIFTRNEFGHFDIKNHYH